MEMVVMAMMKTYLRLEYRDLLHLHWRDHPYPRLELPNGIAHLASLEVDVKPQTEQFWHAQTPSQSVHHHHHHHRIMSLTCSSPSIEVCFDSPCSLEANEAYNWDHNTHKTRYVGSLSNCHFSERNIKVKRSHQVYHLVIPCQAKHQFHESNTEPHFELCIHHHQEPIGER